MVDPTTMFLIKFNPCRRVGTPFHGLFNPRRYWLRRAGSRSYQLRFDRWRAHYVGSDYWLAVESRLGVARPLMAPSIFLGR